MMPIVVVSDTHSRNEILDILEERYKDAYAFIHCGDLEDDPRYYPRWLIVRGNNDYFGKFREDLRIKVGSHRIYVTHSHRCSYLYREKNLERLAQEYGCDIVCYGHTHISKITNQNGILMVNPGSCWLPRAGKEPSYALINIEGSRVEAKIIEQKDWDF